MDVRLTLRVNGKPRRVTASEDAFLPDVLRDRLALSGAKNGCGLGACGAYAVLCGREPTPDRLREAGEQLATECAPLSDTEASEWYRQEMVAVFVRHSATVALERARGGAEP